MSTIVIDNLSELDIKGAWQVINSARTWAIERFNANPDGSAKEEESSPLHPPTCYVSFPDVDRMDVTPCLFGRPQMITAHYRLAFSVGGAQWRLLQFKA